jgi:lysophospholipase L1-like esterase
MLETRSLPSSAAVIQWRMVPRFAPGPHRGQLELPNTPAYVNPPSGYEVRLDASRSRGIQASSTFTWTIRDGSATVTNVEGEQPGIDLPQGTYTVQLEADHLRGTSGPVVVSQTVVVKNIVIVSIGDSYGSGEGNPVVKGYYFFKSAKWAFSPDPAMNVENAKGHRSTLSASAQFAVKLEKSDPHEAVTFVSVANSGATIAQGLLGPMQSNSDSHYTLPAEIAEAHQIVGAQPINVLTVSIGGNDIGFSTRIKQLATNTLGFGPSLSTIRSQVNSDLATLPAQYNALGQAIQGLDPSHVMITQYPDLTRNEHGQFAPIKYLGITLISTADVRFAARHILAPLNQAVENAAVANGWTYVDGLGSAFKTHGYSSSDSWFRNLGDSFEYEGSALGAFHPNFKGQRAIANRLFQVYQHSTNEADAISPL